MIYTRRHSLKMI